MSSLKETLERIEKKLDYLTELINNTKSCSKDNINVYINAIENNNICYYGHYFVCNKTSQSDIRLKSNISIERGFLLSIYSALQLIIRSYLDNSEINIYINNKDIINYINNSNQKDQDLIKEILFCLDTYNISINYLQYSPFITKLLEEIKTYKEKIEENIKCLHVQESEQFQKMK